MYMLPCACHSLGCECLLLHIHLQRFHIYHTPHTTQHTTPHTDRQNNNTHHGSHEQSNMQHATCNMPHATCHMQRPHIPLHVLHAAACSHDLKAVTYLLYVQPCWYACCCCLCERCVCGSNHVCAANGYMTHQHINQYEHQHVCRHSLVTHMPNDREAALAQ